MPRISLSILALALALISVVATKAADDVSAGDLKKLEGVWTATNPDGSTVTYTFKGDQLKLVGPNRTYSMTVKLNGEAKPEKTIDFKIDEGPEDAKGKTSKGIYKFEGDDKFIYCFSPEGDRPAKYEQVGFEVFLMELKKKK